MTLVASALAGGDCIDDADACDTPGPLHPTLRVSRELAQTTQHRPIPVIAAGTGDVLMCRLREGRAPKPPLHTDLRQ